MIDHNGSDKSNQLRIEEIPDFRQSNQRPRTCKQSRSDRYSDLLNIRHLLLYRQLSPYCPNAELIEMIIPDKPGSRMQKYRMTVKGKDFLQEDKEDME